MKNWLLIFLIVGLTGCRLIFVGPEPLGHQWKKDGVYLQGKNFRKCYDRAENAMTEREKYLDNAYSERELTPEEMKEWDLAMDRFSKIHYGCAYELGYRFKPDLGWCWEGSFNMRMCDKYKKYRN
ncbi:hypothetical protein [Otariodibacter oris]|uniref:Lipoprotein n=1 Tax=Otariodibacter oris TaxID=1032623 RepID=A0A420XHY1_9PAST|nr:hypothetical protein [Otariodibacter oris]QGM80845.1 hypothetical protein A6A10_05225 [Otariodibacter oris]RKR76984.1 hypothetical protein DES31_0297 [Otariodibacter oris]